MATTATTLQDIRINYPNLFDKFDLRGQKYSLTQLALRNTANPQGIISADLLNKARISWGRGIDIPVFSQGGQANGTGLTCTFTGTQPVSDIVNVTFVTISNGFEMQPAKNFQNEMTYPQEFMRQFTDSSRKIAVALDALFDTTLTSNITPAAQYASSYVGVGNRYPFVADKMQVDLGDRANFMNDLTDILAADDLEDQTFDVVLSTNGRSIVRQIFAQGPANDTNTAYQFTMGDFDFVFSNRVTQTAATDATGFALPKGAIGIVSRNSPDAMANNRTSDGHQFSTMFNEIIGLTTDTLTFSTCGDVQPESGNADDTTAVREFHQQAIHIGILTPYENFAGSAVSGVIRKFDWLKV